MTDLVTAPAPTRQKARKKATGKAAYVALHGTRLARCIAAGTLSGRIYDRGQAPLQFTSAPVDATILAAARDDAPYGIVALIEFPLTSIRDRSLAMTPELPAPLSVPMPLAYAQRVIFRTEADMVEFTARISGYDDVPLNVIPYAVDAQLFQSDNGGVLFSSIAPTASSSFAAPPDPHIEVRLRNIDKTSGAITAALSIANGQFSQHDAGTTIAQACIGTPQPETPSDFISRLCNGLDADEGGAHGNEITRVAATVLACADPATGFDPDAFLASLVEQSQGLGIDTVVMKFVHGAQDVLVGRRELNTDSFIDAPGKIALRALLLFMLNPDTGRLINVHRRVSNVGHRVQMLASALAGCLTGFANLTASVKAPNRDVYRSVVLLACGLESGQPAGLDVTSIWTVDGAQRTSVEVDGVSMYSNTAAAPACLTTLRTALAALAVEASFDLTTGDLVWSREENGLQWFRARSATSPVFPKTDALDIVLRSSPMSAKAAAKVASDVNSKARITGVFAQVVSTRKERFVEFSAVFSGAELGQSLIPAVINALIAEGNKHTLPAR